ncbi:type II toxin-antitoxin system RelE/ParE family toxin [Nostocaceae cyanobacterium CENA357]|uniref:Type II toxin-antitoxin system RelE/ParE family toxin n=1 Tax=Atlanticothrix silvestris CENA357 TaxID=1725252 RepID=A0A8J7HH78_9CYAN|nr:type II toxin-antitoxin system RelE/ParE family toxin [Atlanticothrix silvestris]MBH8552303.1 type II toxin-antitoxin system RelE/ParE family toxin [Atlanticothrix silvestris CENA357]
MCQVYKRPQVIRDLIELATYIAEDNLDASDRFLIAAEETFKQLGKMPGVGKLCQFSSPHLAEFRQQSIKGFKNYLVFYRSTNTGVEIVRVIHGARDLEAILDDNFSQDD